MAHRSLARLALAALGWTLVVILGGAYVRASGSGAGCGNHWPTCHGELLPRPETLASVIEWSHRFTSGLAGLLVLLLWWRSARRLPTGHPARITAATAFAAMCLEALIGAALVRLELVAGNASLRRGIWMTAHLSNTFLLLAALLLTWRLLHVPRSAQTSGNALASAPTWRWQPLLPSLPALLALLLASLSGGIAALGDTLFPSGSLAIGWQQDLSAASHLWLRLRLWHPLLSLLAAGLVGATAIWQGLHSTSPRRWRLPRLVIAALSLQAAGGLLNLLLLAPLPMQILHLAGADLVWLLFVLLAAEPCLQAESRNEKMVSSLPLRYDSLQ